MVSHYTLQAKDHKFAVKEQDFTPKEVEQIKIALRHYQYALERSYDNFYVEEQMLDVAQSLKEQIEYMRQIRRKLDGND